MLIKGATCVSFSDYRANVSGHLRKGITQGDRLLHTYSCLHSDYSHYRSLWSRESCIVPWRIHIAVLHIIIELKQPHYSYVYTFTYT